jgi:hypothetical protein
MVIVLYDMLSDISNVSAQCFCERKFYFHYILVVLSEDANTAFGSIMRRLFYVRGGTEAAEKALDVGTRLQ